MPTYHLTSKTVNKDSGKSANEKYAYINRQGKYATEKQIAVFTESGNMPVWAEKTQKYWKAADEHERGNGRLYKEIEFSLPKELTRKEHIRDAQAFCRHLAQTSDGPLPYSFAIHDRGDGNPHCHLLLSERVNDGHARSADLWFKRAAKEPTKGGARKTDKLKPTDWLIATRERWAQVVNDSLRLAGLDARVDHRTLAAQGIDREPTIHLGPANTAKEKAGIRTQAGNINRLIASANQAREKADPVRSKLEPSAVIEQRSTLAEYIQKAELVRPTPTVATVPAPKPQAPEQKKPEPQPVVIVPSRQSRTLAEYIQQAEQQERSAPQPQPAVTAPILKPQAPEKVDRALTTYEDAAQAYVTRLLPEIQEQGFTRENYTALILDTDGKLRQHAARKDTADAYDKRRFFMGKLEEAQKALAGIGWMERRFSKKGEYEHWQRREKEYAEDARDWDQIFRRNADLQEWERMETLCSYRESFKKSPEYAEAERHIRAEREKREQQKLREEQERREQQRQQGQTRAQTVARKGPGFTR